MDAELAGDPKSNAALPIRRQVNELPGPRALPFIGNGFQLDPSRMHLVLEGWAREHGPTYRVMFGPRPVLVLTELPALQVLAQERPDTFRRLNPVESVMRELGTAGLFSAEGAAWRRQRKLVMPAFSMKQQRDLFPTVTAITDRLRRHWMKAVETRAVIDARADLMRFTVDVTSHLVFGRDLNTLGGAHSDLQAHLNRIFHALNLRTNAIIPYWRYFKLPSDRAVDRSVAHVQALIGGIIADARAALAQDTERAANPTSLLEAMLVSQDEENPNDRFSDEDVSGNVLTLLLAGEDTTSNTLSWMLHYMAHEPEVQRRLHQEALEVFGDGPTASVYEDVAKLKYAMAVTHEALRMRSAAPLNFYESVRDTELEGFALPAGSWVFVLTRYCGMDNEHFGEAASFKPERWLAGQTSITPHNPRAALAFGGGPRTCPGRSLALFECAMVASMVARNFEIEPVSGRDEVEEVFDFTMYPRGLKVRFRAR